METEAERLRGQVGRVYMALISPPGAWWTLAELAAHIGHVSEAGVSARLRDLRKARFGSHTIERRRVPNGNGLHEYRLVRGNVVGIKIKRTSMQDENLVYQVGLLRSYKDLQAEATRKVFEQEALVLDLLETQGVKSTKAGTWKVTVVRGETAVVNESGLAKALGARAWNKLTKKSLDKGKLEKAIADGEVDVNVVSQYTEMRPRKPFVRISEATDAEAPELAGADTT